MFSIWFRIPVVTSPTSSTSSPLARRALTPAGSGVVVDDSDVVVDASSLSLHAPSSRMALAALATADANLLFICPPHMRPDHPTRGPSAPKRQQHAERSRAALP